MWSVIDILWSLSLQLVQIRVLSSSLKMFCEQVLLVQSTLTMITCKRGLRSGAVVHDASNPSSVFRWLCRDVCSAHEVCQNPPGQGSPQHTQDPMSCPVGSQSWERGGGQDWLRAECSLQSVWHSQLHLCFTSNIKHQTSDVLLMCLVPAPVPWCRPSSPGGAQPQG